MEFFCIIRENGAERAYKELTLEKKIELMKTSEAVLKPWQELEQTVWNWEKYTK